MNKKGFYDCGFGITPIVFLIWLIIVFIIGLVAGLTFNFVINNNEPAQKDYTFSETRALCDRDNFCRDFVYYYNGNKLISIVPTPNTLQLPK